MTRKMTAKLDGVTVLFLSRELAGPECYMLPRDVGPAVSKFPLQAAEES